MEKGSCRGGPDIVVRSSLVIREELQLSKPSKTIAMHITVRTTPLPLSSLILHLGTDDWARPLENDLRSRTRDSILLRATVMVCRCVSTPSGGYEQINLQASMSKRRVGTLEQGRGTLPLF